MLKIAGSWYNGDKETEVYYSLVSTEMCDGSGTQIFAIVRDYGEHVDGTPAVSVTLVCVDDGSIENYDKAVDMFNLFIGKF